MIDALPLRGVVRSFRRGGLLCVLLAVTAIARAQAPEPLARYVPADGLAALVEHDGVAGHAQAWKATAAYKMLNETSLGAMIEDIAVQLADRGLQTAPEAPLSGKELVALLSYLIEKGFVFGFIRDPRGRDLAGRSS